MNRGQADQRIQVGSSVLAPENLRTLMESHDHVHQRGLMAGELQ